MDNITNTTFIDASRTNCETTNNNSQWTNVVSSGLKLNAGDKVSVGYSCVNEIGCGSTALETTGKLLKTAVNYSYTEITNFREESVSDTEFNIELGPYGSLTTSCENKIKQITPKDNDFNVVVSYYKNTNGENYVHLPRGYDNGIDPLQETIPYDELGTGLTEGVMGKGPVGWKNRNDARAKAWYQPDDPDNGRPWQIPKYRCYADWHWYEGNRHYFPTSSTALGMSAHNDPVPTRGEQYYDINDWKRKNDNSRYTLYQSAFTAWTTEGVDENVYEELFTDRDPAYQHYRKYKELKEYTVSAGFNDPHNVAYQLTSQITDPKLGPQPVSVHQVNYVAPSLTKTPAVPDYDTQISMVSNGEVYKPFAAANWKTLRKGTAPAGNANQKSHSTGAWSNYYNGQLYNEQTADATLTAAEQLVQKKEKQQDILDYQSSYNIVGMKRPEIYDAGKAVLTQHCKNEQPNLISDGTEIGSSVGEIEQSALGGDKDTCYEYPQLLSKCDGVNDGAVGGFNNKSPWLVTNMKWYDQGGNAQSGTDKTTKLLETLRDLFAAQRLYPETLQFPKRNTATNNVHKTSVIVMDTPALPPTLEYEPSVIKSGIRSPFNKRYLHTNRQTTIARGNDRLGNDDVGTVASTYGSTHPMWFYFDEKLKDTYIDDPRKCDIDYAPAGFDKVNFTSEQLCYGFAMKHSIGNEDYIALNIQGVSTEYIADGAYWLGAAANCVSGIGYDIHHDAYGTDNIVLYSGTLPCNEQTDSCVGVNKQGEEVAAGWQGQGGPTQGPPDNPSGAAQTYRDGRDMPPEGYGISSLIRQVYIGAIDPIIQFLDTNSRFQIGNLHTPEYQQNPAQAGKPVENTIPQSYIPTLADEGTEIYKINKKITMWNNYTPDMLPYRSEDSFKAPHYQFGEAYTTKVQEIAPATTRHFRMPVEIGGQLKHATTGGTGGYQISSQAATAPNKDDATFKGRAYTSNSFKGYADVLDGRGERKIDTAHEYLEMNYNLSKFVVYDSHSGIYLEDFGITDKDDWRNSLFGIMGFAFEDFNPEPEKQLNRQTKLTRVNYNVMKPLTTCAAIPLKDAPTAVKNLWQKTMYNCQLPVPQLANLWFGYFADFWYETAANPPKGKEWAVDDDARERQYYQIGDQNQPQIYPMIQNPQTSGMITAIGLPIKMKSPYYLIKSDIICDSYYLRDKTPLPIVAVVNKENGFGDFYFSQAAQQTFTITQPTTLTEIRTEIYDADMTLARCDPNSAVIYKVEKQVSINLDLAASLLTTGADGEISPKKGVLGNFGKQQ